MSRPACLAGQAGRTPASTARRRAGHSRPERRLRHQWAARRAPGGWAGVCPGCRRCSCWLPLTAKTKQEYLSRW